MFNPAGQRVTVMGLGRFGGGLGVTRFLLDHGAQVHLTDQLPEADLADSLQPLQQDLTTGQLTLRLGEHDTTDFTSADAVVVNPAVPPHNPFIQAAQAAGVPLLTEIGLLIERLPNRKRVIGITGTAGKSTTAAMTAHLLSQHLQNNPPRGSHPTVHLGGNLGGSLLPTAHQITPDDYVVLELSSFMLHYLRPLQWSPHIAVITNLSDNHLDWHGNPDHYRTSKQAILDYQSDADGDWAFGGPGTHDVFQEKISINRVDLAGEEGWRTVADHHHDLLVPGLHNQMNARLAVFATAAVLGIETDPPDDEFWDLMPALADFPGLPHRLQLVHQTPPTNPSLRCCNDSKSTTPDAAILAIDAFRGDTRITEPQGPHPELHLILGGYDKSADLTALAQHAARYTTAVYTLGTTGPALADAIEAAPNRRATVYRCDTLDTAITTAKSQISPNPESPTVLLLSPGCASWDQFPNYEARGNAFTQLVRQHFTA